MKRLLLLSIILVANHLYAQKKLTISGFVKDKENGESLVGVNVYILDSLGDAEGTSTNIYGFYSLSLLPGSYTLTYSYLGFSDVKKNIVLDNDIQLNTELSTDSEVLDEIVITDKKAEENIKSTQMGKVELTTERIKSMPALMGEVDIIKAIQLLPGVQAAGEGNSGIYVRGGGPDQNLVLLDDAVVYNVGHLFGFFSVFNADAVKNTTLIKGGMPANYGGRISSVIDINMKEGNNKKFEMEGGIGIISSRLTLQGPIQKEKSSFLISARRTYAFDIAQPFLKKTEFAGTNYNFYDLNVKANYILSDKDRLYLSGYFGRDVFIYASNENDTKIKIPWGNATSTLRWNHLFSNKIFMNASYIFNDYKFEFEGQQLDFKFNIFSGVRDHNIKIDFDYYQSTKHKIKFGYQYIHHRFTPTTAKASTGDTNFESTESKKYAHEMALYLQDDWDITDKLKVNYGFRLSFFQHTGPYTSISGDPASSSADTTYYDRFEKVKNYLGPEPRIGMRYAWDNNNSIKAGVAMNYQYVHLVSNSNSTLPTDVWVPSSALVAPQWGLQYSLGYFRNIKEDQYELSAEIYYKDMRNQIDYGESFVQELNIELEKGFVFGKGWSYGLELFAKKNYGKFNGFIGYTLSYANRKFPEINNGQPFPAKFDRRHDISINLVYDINKVWSLGATWVYATGNAFTVPVEYYFVENTPAFGYAERNSYRLPAYHRMDFSVTAVPNKKPQKRFKSTYNFSIYNAYNRKNTYFIYYKLEGDNITGNLTAKAIKVSIFPIIPSFTWNFKF
jgi:hypothetical protein